MGTLLATWTEQESDHPASFDFLLKDSNPVGDGDAMFKISLLYRNDSGGTGYMVVDAELSEDDRTAGAQRTLSREEVVGTALAADLFSVLDVLYLQDERIRAIRTLPPADE